MNAKAESTADKLARWAPIFEKFRESGLSQVKFCERESISYPNFAKWWQRRNRDQPARSRLEKPFIPVQLEIESSSVPLPGPESYAELVVHLPMGVTLCFRGRG